VVVVTVPLGIVTVSVTVRVTPALVTVVVTPGTGCVTVTITFGNLDEFGLECREICFVTVIYSVIVIGGSVVVAVQQVSVTVSVQYSVTETILVMCLAGAVTVAVQHVSHSVIFS